MRINQLPAATEVAQNDVLAIDTSNGTYQVPRSVLAPSPYIATIPTGQWSGSDSDYYITVMASNVTADSILYPFFDSESEALLTGPVWAVPAAGSFTIHTSAIPAGTVTISVLLAGVVGEAQYQVLADVYSTSQVDSIVAQSTAKTEFTGTLSLAAGVTLTNFSARKVAGIVYMRSVVQKSLTLGSWNELFTLPEGYRPKEDFYTCFLNATSDKAIEARITATGVAYVYPVSDTASASATNIAFSLTFIQ